jgi:hypothetical protein
MRIKNIKISDYPGFDKIDMNIENNNVTLITANSYGYPIEEITEIFLFLLMLGEEDAEEDIKQTIFNQLSNKITTFEFEFTVDNHDYYYFLQMSKEGVHSEEVYKDKELSFMSEEHRSIPRLPEGVDLLFKEFIFIDLSRPGWIDDMLHLSEVKCKEDGHFVSILRNLLKEFELAKIVELKHDLLYIDNEPLTEVVESIRFVVALIPAFLDSFGSGCMLFLSGFDTTVSMKVKLQLIRLFDKNTLNVRNSQLIFCDESNYDDYRITIKKHQRCELSQGYDESTFTLTNTYVEDEKAETNDI